MTRQTDPTWPDKLSAWMYERDREVHVTTRHYWAGPFPRWNCWVKDPYLARGLANELELFLGSERRSPLPNPLLPAREEREALSTFDVRPSTGFYPPLWLVAHSNGAVIALLTAKRLIARGHQIGGLILTGAACEADVERNGMLVWWNDGMLGAAIAYSSKDDEVLAGDPAHSLGDATGSILGRVRQWCWGKLMWPYGCLGRTGWLLSGQPLEPSFCPSLHDSITPPLQSVFTRWFRGGHGCYFTPGQIEHTFEQMYEDIECHVYATSSSAGRGD